MDDREQTIHERITEEINKRVLELLKELKEADEKGDKEKADQVVDKLVQLAETYWPWMIRKGKIDPVQEAIWAIRLAKSPGLWDTLRTIFLGETPHQREERKKLAEKRAYYAEMKDKMEWYLYQFKEIVSPLYRKYYDLYRLLETARTKDGKPFPEWWRNQVKERMSAAGVLESALKHGRELNPEALMNLYGDMVRTLIDTDGLTGLTAQVTTLLGFSDVFIPCSELLTEIKKLTWDFIKMLRSMRQEGFRPISISREEVEEEATRLAKSPGIWRE